MLTDPVGRTVYRPAMRNNVFVMCSPTLRRVISEGETLRVTCTFLDVPPQTRQLTLDVHYWGRIRNLPVR